MVNVAFDDRSGKSPFEKISRTFLDDPALNFPQARPAETIEMMFRKYDGLFGGKYFNTVFVVWAFLLQTLSDKKTRSCSTAVGRITAFCFASGKALPDSNTGNYCHARARLSIDALHELVVLVAKNTETGPAVQAFRASARREKSSGGRCDPSPNLLQERHRGCIFDLNI